MFSPVTCSVCGVQFNVGAHLEGVHARVAGWNLLTCVPCVAVLITCMEVLCRTSSIATTQGADAAGTAICSAVHDSPTLLQPVGGPADPNTQLQMCSELSSSAAPIVL